MPKEHKEFHTVDMGSASWRWPPGYPEDIEQKILAGSLDEKSKTGNLTRLLGFRPARLRGFLRLTTTKPLEVGFGSARPVPSLLVGEVREGGRAATPRWRRAP